MASNITSLIGEVPKLTGNNYLEWKFAVSMVLRRAGAWDVVSGETMKPTKGDTSEWESKAEEGLTIIGLTVQPDQYHYIRDCSNGAEAWKVLSHIYELSSGFQRIALQRQFYGFEQDPKRPIQEFISGILGLATRLKAMGDELVDSRIIAVFAVSLDNSWNDVATVLSALADDGHSVVADAVRILLAEERRREARRGTIEGDVASGSRSGRQRRVGTKCFRCGKSGHMAKQCKEPEPKKTSNKEKTAHPKENYAF